MSVVAAIAVSCNGTTDDSRAQAAKSLYNRSVSLTLAYTDSMAAAKDSASILRMSKEFDDSLTRLNFNFPADTDLDMSEGQNDTLIRLNRRYVQTRDSMLYHFSHHPANDSIAKDSTTVEQSKVK